MSKTHTYAATTKWTGNLGKGTSDYKGYERSHAIAINDKADLLCSSDPAFRGDKTRHNPEDLLVASISGCHMLWYLHLCSVNGIIVTHYLDQAVGVMAENPDGSGQFTEVVLAPRVTVQDPSMIEKANALHDQAHSMCFIARSVNFPVHHKSSATAENS